MNRRLEKGFSIIQVMVSLALMAIVSTVFMKMTSNSQKSQVSVSSVIEFDTLKSSVAMLLSRSDLCSQAFKNETNTQFAKFGPGVSSGDQLGTLVLGSQVVAQKGLIIGGGGVVDAVDLAEVPGTTPFIDLANDRSIYAASLVLRLKKPSGSYGAAQIDNSRNPFIFNLIVKSSTMEIVGCSSSGDGVSDDDEDASGSCPSGTFMYGTGLSGKPRCRSFEMSCATDHFMKGILEDGQPDCVPLPSAPIPAMPDIAVGCSSRDYKAASCPVIGLVSGNVIKTVAVAVRHSNSSCKLDKSFGLSADKKSIWVKSGCRATFRTTQGPP